MKKLIMAAPKVVPDKALLATVIFTVPPAGSASVGMADSAALIQLQGRSLNDWSTPYCCQFTLIVLVDAAAWQSTSATCMRKHWIS